MKFSNHDNIWKIKNVQYNNGKSIDMYRLYNEYNTDSNFALYNETTLKLHELIEKFNFKVYHLKTTPATNLKITLGKYNNINSIDKDIQKIKFLQNNDLYFLYMNLFFEVLYFFPHIDSNNNYSYSFIIVLDKSFDINKILKHNFNLITIKSFTELSKDTINFNIIKNIFESRTLIDNWIHSENEFKYKFIGLPSSEEYLAYYGVEKHCLTLQQITNLEFINFNQNFNQNLYCQSYFKLLCTHIITFGKVFYIEENLSGKTFNYEDIYDINSTFFTNFHDIVDSKTVFIERDAPIIKESDYYGSCIWDNIHDQMIKSTELSKEFVLNGFIDFSDKKIIKINK